MNKNFDFILFGATGDLALRKIFPALYLAYLKNEICEFNIFAIARSKFSTEEFLAKLDEKSKIHIKDLSKWDEFIKNISYTSVNINLLDDFLKLSFKNKQKIIYFSISPDFFIQCCENLSKAKLIDNDTQVILEKPLGMNKKECDEINNQVAKYFKEEQIYRIDHYLGKLMVQELFNLRKNNIFFNSFLNKKYVKSIELSVLETLGVLNRGEFYDSCGCLKDMLQNHMLQMLSLFMIDINCKDIRAAKSNFFKNLKCDEFIKAQYLANKDALNYTDELNVKKDSKTDTFIAIKMHSLLEEYEGINIYLRSGKKMHKNCVYFIVNFKDDSYLRIQIQPNPKIEFFIKCNEKLQIMNLNLENLDDKEPYERLILSALKKDLRLFNEKEELSNAWLSIMDIVDNNNFIMQYYKAYENTIHFKDCEFKE